MTPTVPSLAGEDASISPSSAGPSAPSIPPLRCCKRMASIRSGFVPNLTMRPDLGVATPAKNPPERSGYPRFDCPDLLAELHVSALDVRHFERRKIPAPVPVTDRRAA